MKLAVLFPGQGAQYPGMGKSLVENFSNATTYFEKANEILGFNISKIMFEGSIEDLKKTSITQPAIYLHSVILAKMLKMMPDMVAGHSLGEFSALAASGAVSFEDGLRLVQIRANAMQEACDAQKTTMAAIVGIDDSIVEEVCKEIGENQVVPANYNSPGQLVISGSLEAVNQAIDLAKSKGAKIAKILEVDGAFHSPFMESARKKLAEGIAKTSFQAPTCPIYQNVTGKGVIDPEEIRKNLNLQLTAPVLWTQSVKQMIEDGATDFIELGPGAVLQGLVKRIDKTKNISGREV